MREAIKANTAWKAGRLGSRNVTVAILDTGIGEFRCTNVSNRTGRCTNEATHPDLTNRVDRDRSKSFVPSDDALVQQNFPGTPLWTDLHFHGTHVAATVSSNASRYAGVTSKVNLMAVKVLNRNGAGTTSGILDGLMYAADNGADVINLSLGGSFTKKPDDLDAVPPGFVSVINRAINYANDKGSTIVVSAGNDNRDLKANPNVYQAYCQSPHVICVSATGPTSSQDTNGPWTNIDAKASYSNYGPPIVVAAPGGNTGGSVFAACSKTSAYVTKDVDLRSCQATNTVGSVGLKGTSQAAPHVSGLAALLVEDIGKGHPSEVAARIRKSADDLGRRGKDEVYGQGRINVANALNLP
jgi:lantibiotic leader peptide-processing serine protease